jgi:hypothetical protein
VSACACKKAAAALSNRRRSSAQGRRLERGNDPQQVVVLETENFGRYEVVVRRASQVCQVAEKKPILIGQITPVWP